MSNSVSLLMNRGMPIDEISKHVLAASSRKPKGTEPVETVFMLTKSALTPQKVDQLLAGHNEAYVYQATSARVAAALCRSVLRQDRFR